jgi:hypothetical protein
MHLKQRFNKFENEVYSRILDYWLELSLGYIDFSSEADKNLIKHLGLLETDYFILEKFYQTRLASH